MQNAGTILLGDDDSDYAELLRIALKQAGIHNSVHVVSNGEEIVRYLKGKGVYADRAAHPLPRLVLLDVKLPLRHGFDVLRWIRRQPRLRHLIVVMLSGSDFENEAKIAYELGASTFLVKPMRFQTLVEMLTHHRDSWLQEARPFPETGRRMRIPAPFLESPRQSVRAFGCK